MRAHSIKVFDHVQMQNSTALTILMACNMFASQNVRRATYDLRRLEREQEMDAGPLSGTPAMLMDQAPADSYPRQDIPGLDGVDHVAERTAAFAKLRTELNAGYKLLVASAEAIVRQSFVTEANNYGQQVKPYAWVLGLREDGSRRFYGGIPDVLKDNELYQASRNALDRQASITAFGDILSDEERRAASINTSMGAKAMAAERRAELETVISTHLTSKYDPKEKDTKQLFAEIKRHIRELGADPELVAASAIWRSAMAMKKAAIGAINPRTSRPYQMQLDAEIISLAVQLKKAGYEPDSEQNKQAVLADLDQL